MDDVSEAQFYAQFPLWYLATDGPVPAADPSLRARIPHGFIGGEADGTGFVAVFTDTDLAERFVTANDLNGAALRRIRDARHFLKLLGRFPPEATHVSFDPGGVGSMARVLIPVGTLAGTLRELLDS
jgi:hypothetical protein